MGGVGRRNQNVKDEGLTRNADQGLVENDQMQKLAEETGK